MFTRRLDGFQGKDRPDYWQRLKTLGIYSLERRRERYMAIYAWKVIHENVPNIGLSLIHI